MNEAIRTSSQQAGKPISMIVLCLLIIMFSGASTITVRWFNQAAHHHVDRVLLFQGLIQQTERLQRAEIRLSSDQIEPLTPFPEIVQGMRNQMDANPSLLSADERAIIDDRLNHYLAGPVAEENMSLAGDLAGVQTYREAVTMPSGSTVNSLLTSESVAARANEQRARSTADRVLIGSTVLMAVFIVGLLLRYDRGRRQAQGRIVNQEQRFRSLIQQGSDLIVVTDVSGLITYASPAAERIFNLSLESSYGRTILDHVFPDDREALASLMQRSITAEGQPVRGEITVQSVRGDLQIMDVTAVDMLDIPSLRGIVITAHDVTERRTLLEAFRHQAQHDSLTGLPNRALLTERLTGLMATARLNGEPFSLLFVDLDDFKRVNDAEGHEIGDQLLVAAALGLRRAVRADDIVARFGGDEFVLLLPETDEDAAILAVSRVSQVLGSLVVRDREYDMRASIGIAVWTERVESIEELLRQADQAMYLVKQSGKTGYAIYRTGSISFGVAA